jgi:hypothetical protein
MAIIVVSGALANRCHNGGGAWVRLSWLRGFQRLGFRVHFLEQIDRATCVDGVGAVAPFEESVNLAYFQQVMERFGLATSATLIYERGEQRRGLSWQELHELADAADLLVNISGHLTCPSVLSRFRRRAHLDIDPGFAQIWHAGGIEGARLTGHNLFFTIAENIAMPGCLIPLNGVPWRRTRQPVVLEDWPVVAQPPERRFTTVASWRGAYGPVEFGGMRLGVKAHEFRKYMELPMRCGLPFEIALNIHEADFTDLEALRRNRWRIIDPQAVAAYPEAFRGYVQRSTGEFSVAQHIYVATHSGWFSDRSVRYLASGKPALVQDTEFSRHLPVGDGLVPFNNLDEAVSAAKRIVDELDHHSKAARQVAEENFDSDKVLRRFCDDAGICV